MGSVLFIRLSVGSLVCRRRWVRNAKSEEKQPSNTPLEKVNYARAKGATVRELRCVGNESDFDSKHHTLRTLTDGHHHRNQLI